MREKICQSAIQTALLTTVLAIAACSVPPVAPAPAAPATAQAALQASQGAYRIVAGESLLTITVRRGGPLARMGHDHLIASRQVEGFIDEETGRSELRFRLDQLTVDEPALRRQAGLMTQPSADAVDGTRRNMFSKVLLAETYPWVVVRATLAAGSRDVLDAAITLHGVTRGYHVPVQWHTAGGALQASGAFVVKQSDFGINPYSVLGGALAVKDELELQFAISARQSGASPGRQK